MRGCPSIDASVKTEVGALEVHHVNMRDCHVQFRATKLECRSIVPTSTSHTTSSKQLTIFLCPTLFTPFVLSLYLLPLAPINDGRHCE